MFSRNGLQVHLLVLSALLTSNSSYGVYFLQDPKSDKKNVYSAIVGVKGEYRVNSDEKIQVIYF